MCCKFEFRTEPHRYNNNNATELRKPIEFSFSVFFSSFFFWFCFACCFQFYKVSASSIRDIFLPCILYISYTDPNCNLPFNKPATVMFIMCSEIHFRCFFFVFLFTLSAPNCKFFFGCCHYSLHFKKILLYFGYVSFCSFSRLLDRQMTVFFSSLQRTFR